MDILVGLKSLFIFRFIICGDFLKSGFSLFPLIVLDCRAHLVSVRRDSVARKVVTTWLFFPPLRPTFFTHLKWFLSFPPCFSSLSCFTLSFFSLPCFFPPCPDFKSSLYFHYPPIHHIFLLVDRPVLLDRTLTNSSKI